MLVLTWRTCSVIINVVLLVLFGSDTPTLHLTTFWEPLGVVLAPRDIRYGGFRCNLSRARSAHSQAEAEPTAAANPSQRFRQDSAPGVFETDTCIVCSMFQALAWPRRHRYDRLASQLCCDTAVLRTMLESAPACASSRTDDSSLSTLQVS